MSERRFACPTSLDKTTGQELLETVRQEPLREGETVVIDFADTQSINTLGGAWLVEIADWAREAKGGIRLENPASSADLLRRPEVQPDTLQGLSVVLGRLPPDDRRVAAETIKYCGYVERQRREAQRVQRAGARRIPDTFLYKGLSGLSNELVEKLDHVRPETYRLGDIPKLLP